MIRSVSAPALGAHSMEAPGKRFYYKQNRLKKLRAFCYAAQAMSISKAAERLFLSQPSVSLQVRALEQELSVTLFERRGPRIDLTPEGHVLYDLASPLVEGMDALPATFAERCGNLESGKLDIAAGESTILYILPTFMQAFARKYPGIQLRMHNVTGRDGLSQLRADKVDFAVGSMLEVPDDIEYQPIFSYDTVLITGRDHPLANKRKVALEDISPHGLILPPRHLSTWRVVDLVFQQHSVPYNVTLEAGGWEVIKKYVGLGLGISIVSSICLSDDDDLCAIPLGQYFPKRTYGVVLRRGKFLSPAARRFIAAMDPEFFKNTAAAAG
ncbi:MAG: LysR family transcriptional regulator [Gammaproteobacteria bacterium]|nr:LysR family transcriptional regulator [Gammaproteobacteria bacterium]